MSESLHSSTVPPVPAAIPAGPLAVPHPFEVGGPPPGQSAQGGDVIIAAGLYVQRFPVAGQTVGRIRTRLRSRLAIEDRAVAVVDGREASPDTLVMQGQTLTFVRRAGERGLGTPNF